MSVNENSITKIFFCISRFSPQNNKYFGKYSCKWHFQETFNKIARSSSLDFIIRLAAPISWDFKLKESNDSEKYFGKNT